MIGIGAGPSTDGQVLVLHDLLTIHDDFQPKFAKRFAAVKEEMRRGVEAYADEVRTRTLPRRRSTRTGSRPRSSSASGRARRRARRTSRR